MSLISWTEAQVVVTRFTHLVDANLRELQQQYSSIQRLEAEGQIERLSIEKSNADCLINQIQLALQQVLEIRSKLDPSAHSQFDERIEPVRLRIQSTLKTITAKPKSMPSTNPFDGDTDPNFFDETTGTQTHYENCYESQLLQEQSQIHANQRVQELKLRTEQAKEQADATKKLESDIEDLNQIMIDLAQLVHSQHEMVDSIEEQVERSTYQVHQGHQQLKKAVKTKQAKYPLVAAAVGSIALGGPIGLAAGSAIAGVAAGIGGAVAGLWGGRAIRQKTFAENSTSAETTTPSN
ncbi:T-SNARE coiled-coil-like proteiny domain-containing protein [Aphelenchoides besseyi]|nr:T-SNARE coiled-coil-like proteiny domain-containing protein [Aphelenchoides besseyi]KAI6195439.1 T-SNARE coiled-coil-like proteiny domain-containing protein [Aphelenchoides besseyi]